MFDCLVTLYFLRFSPKLFIHSIALKSDFTMVITSRERKAAGVKVRKRKVGTLTSNYFLFSRRCKNQKKIFKLFFWMDVGIHNN